MSNTNYETPNFQFAVEDEEYEKAVIKVIGIGGGGGNAISHMLTKGIEGVSFCAANTDVQALSKIETIFKSINEKNNIEIPYYGIKLGQETTRGLGAGARPDIGQKAVQESIDSIKDYLHGSDMVFITAGMGGGTGTGGAAVVASLAKQMGILTVGVVTKPFTFEGKPRSRNAEQGIKALAEHVDSLIIIPNEKLMHIMGKNTSMNECFETANDVLYNAVHGISDLITRPGLINVDFADVKTVMSSMGMTMMGTGIASGEERAAEATKKAINSPLLEHIDIKGAKGILVNIIADDSLSIGEFNEIGAGIREYADPDANIIIGSSFDPNMKENIMVTLVATGVESAYNEAKNRENNTEYKNSHNQEPVNASEHLVRHNGESQNNNDESIYHNERKLVNEERSQDRYESEVSEDQKKKSRLSILGFGRSKKPDLNSDSQQPRQEESSKNRYPERDFNRVSEPSLNSLRPEVEDRPLDKEEPSGLSRFLSKRG